MVVSQSLLLDRIGAVLLLNQSTCLEHLADEILRLLSCLKLDLALGQLRLQGQDPSILVEQRLELVLLHGVELVDLRPGPATLIIYAAKMDCVTWLGRDDRGRLDDLEDLGVNRNVHVLSVGHGLVTRGDLFFDKLSKWIANHSVADVQNPLGT